MIANIPTSEAMFSRNIAITILTFMETIVFAALFAHIYFLIKKLIVDNIHKINGSLSQITDGNLNVHVNVRENEEFASLSDDINATVDTLKQYRLDVPQVTLLAHELHEAGVDIPEGILTTEELVGALCR